MNGNLGDWKFHASWCSLSISQGALTSFPNGAPLALLPSYGTHHTTFLRRDLKTNIHGPSSLLDQGRVGIHAQQSKTIRSGTANLPQGRSAFEPTQTTTSSSEYVQVGASQDAIVLSNHFSRVNRYMQLYDERGNPTNPRAHEHGRQMREAQNDVLASIGVVERRRSPSQDLPGSFDDRLQSLENEDMAGSAIGIAFILTQNLCTWWIESLRYRISVCHQLPVQVYD